MAVQINHEDLVPLTDIFICSIRIMHSKTCQCKHRTRVIAFRSQCMFFQPALQYFVKNKQTNRVQISSFDLKLHNAPLSARHCLCNVHLKFSCNIVLNKLALVTRQMLIDRICFDKFIENIHHFVGVRVKIICIYKIDSYIYSNFAIISTALKRKSQLLTLVRVQSLLFPKCIMDNTVWLCKLGRNLC